ncbi:MAG: ferrochelatase [Deferrisomatales bacterium]
MSGGEKTAVVLLNMGGPDSLEAVRPFLENLFSDPEILRFPLAGLVRRPLARWIASRRSRRVVEHYRAIGGKSPLRQITEAQARALAEELGDGYSVHVAMRYWHPRAREAARAAREAGARRLVVLPLYPHYCRATTGSSLADLEQALAAEGLGGLPRRTVRSWPEFGPYADALAEAVREALGALPGATVLYSAHGVPVKLIDEGDPYLDQVQATVAAVTARLPGVPHPLAFQSRAAPVRWLEPSVEEALRALAAEGARPLVVVPVSFVSDHIETLHEIDVEYRELAEQLGIAGFARSPSLNTRPAFIRALAELVRSAPDPAAQPRGRGDSAADP